mgnify:CR=1 FL=1
MNAKPQPMSPDEALSLFTTTRSRTQALAAPLCPEDMMLQSMEDASPVKWHLAHTTWFFEEFILKPRVTDYSSPDDRFAVLFNSYYVQAGPRHARDKRGLVSRPDGAAVQAYRDHVENSLNDLMNASRNDTGDGVSPDLSQSLSALGETLVSRFDYEDQLINAMHKAHEMDVA